MTDDYNAKTKGIRAVNGVEVDIEVRGNEDRAEKVMMDLKERLGRLGAAYDEGKAPDKLEDIPPEYKPIFTINWSEVFADE